MTYLLDLNLARGSQSATLYPDYSPDSSRDRAIISHLLMTSGMMNKFSEHYEDLDNPQFILDYCVSISEQWREQVTTIDPEIKDLANQLTQRDCNDVMQSVIHCIRNELKRRLVRRFRHR
ncbi:hypothetical protein RF11_15960 [Thelohanellus kitauei]|uniref:Uncharacterized protein n=1 Tax=Thelohanellus kitauei TaxID=669202 RepID=A0A0C2MH75_THEKT|nr:hypothetical protein RF11_15960 [Thelohanellus kitauei]